MPPLVGIRNDLNMPLGKEASQRAHALCAYVLGFADLSGKGLRIPAEELFALIDRTEFEKMDPQRMQSALIRITDAGHTVFSEPTLTTCLFAPDHPGYRPNAHENGAPTDTRMALCCTKDARRRLGKDFLPFAAKAYARHLARLLQECPDSARDALLLWARGSFAKITLHAEPEQLAALAGPALAPSSQAAPGIFVLGPASKEDLAPLTGAMRLL